MNKHEKDWESIIVGLTHPVLIPPIITNHY